MRFRVGFNPSSSVISTDETPPICSMGPLATARRLPNMLVSRPARRERSCWVMALSWWARSRYGPPLSRSLESILGVRCGVGVPERFREPAAHADRPPVVLGPSPHDRGGRGDQGHRLDGHRGRAFGVQPGPTHSSDEIRAYRERDRVLDASDRWRAGQHRGRSRMRGLQVLEVSLVLVTTHAADGEIRASVAALNAADPGVRGRASRGAAEGQWRSRPRLPEHSGERVLVERSPYGLPAVSTGRSAPTVTEFGDDG